MHTCGRIDALLRKVKGEIQKTLYSKFMSIFQISASHHSSSALPSKPGRPMSARPKSTNYSDRSNLNRSHLNALENVNVMSKHHAAPSSTRPQSRGSNSRLSSAHSLSKWSSLSTSAEMTNSQLTPTS